VSKGRLELFSDAVHRLVITVMVLELRPPAGSALADLGPVPTFATYVLSFVLLGSYWANHHLCSRPRGRSMVGAVGEPAPPSGSPSSRSRRPGGRQQLRAGAVAAYGLLHLLAASAFYGLVKALIAAPDQAPALAVALGRDIKSKISLVVLLMALPLALVAPAIAMAIYLASFFLWIVPTGVWSAPAGLIILLGPPRRPFCLPSRPMQRRGGPSGTRPDPALPAVASATIAAASWLMSLGYRLLERLGVPNFANRLRGRVPPHPGGKLHEAMKAILPAPYSSASRHALLKADNNGASSSSAATSTPKVR